jgi:hypothetical protein|tara:strand:+ start:287 stop:658 length:372 start_codon:yes stop_codon:yes gene_type:complete
MEYFSVTKKGVETLMNVDGRYIKLFLLMCADMVYRENDVVVDGRRLMRWCDVLEIDEKTLLRYMRGMENAGLIKKRGRRWCVIHPLMAFKCATSDIKRIMKVHEIYEENEEKKGLKNVVGNME